MEDGGATLSEGRQVRPSPQRKVQPWAPRLPCTNPCTNKWKIPNVLQKHMLKHSERACRRRRSRVAAIPRVPGATAPSPHIFLAH